MRNQYDYRSHTGIVSLAEKLADKAHTGQFYGPEFPYINHPRAVVSILIRFGFTDYRLICAGWLHDVLEDTDMTYDDMKMYMGQEITDDVAALSEPKVGTRKEKHAITYPKIRQNWRSTIVKLADRLAHLEAGGKKIGMYRKEHPTFKSYFADVQYPDDVAPIVEAMWARMDSLVMDIPMVEQVS